MVDLIQRIKQEAYVIDNRIIKLDHLINQYVDTNMVFDIGRRFAEAYPNATKVITIEASGIAFGVSTAHQLNNIPIVYARKDVTDIEQDHYYHSPIVSLISDYTSDVMIHKNCLNKGDRVLIIDDFLATGSTLWAMVNLVRQSGATLEGVGIVIEKTYLNARRSFEADGIRIHSLANITDIVNNRVVINETY